MLELDSRSPVSWRQFAILMIGCLGLGSRVLGDQPREVARREAVTFTGRVVDVVTAKPVSGASIVVDRLLPGIPASDLPAWAGKTSLTTDNDGRFELTFPPEQAAEGRLSIALGIAHSDYIPRKSSAPLPLVDVLTGRKGGDRPVFETIKLQKGVEYSGRVITPKGKPAAGVAVELVQWGDDGNPSEHLGDETIGTTDRHGRFRLRGPKTHQLAIYVTPTEYAPFQQFWGTDDPENQPDLWAPTDLGQLRLTPGVRLSGRLIDVQGRPIVNQLITARSIFSRHVRTAKTNVDGRFTFAPLRQGNYILLGEGQLQGLNYDISARPITALGTVFGPTKVFLRDGIVPDCVVLRELPSVVIDMKFVDGKDRPIRGNFVAIGGVLPAINNQPVQHEAIFEHEGLAASINGPEQEDKSEDLQWAAQVAADAGGRLVLRVPKGLREGQIYTLPPNESIAISSRLGEGKPLKPCGTGQFEDLDADIKGVTFIYHQSPRIMATVLTEDGESPAVNIQVNSLFNDEGEEFGAGFVEQADGRYRSLNLLPDQDYEITAWATGFVPNRVHRLRPIEGASIDLTLTLRRQPKPIASGDFAPPFLIKTLAGNTLALNDLRGKFVLLHFWSPDVDSCVEELPHIKAIRDRFGTSDRLTMLGLCLVSDPKAAVEFIKEKRISWPQAILRDRAADSIVIAYQAGDVPKTFLIGPDGKIVARDLAGDKVAEAVAKVLVPEE
jgi:peroxiredoxin/5-hydroxyisourate hydrolase-like protein (transthyretin family)